MDANLALGESASGPGATGPGGRPVSLPVAELTRSVGLIAGDDGRDTAATLIDRLANSGRSVLMFDPDGRFADRSTPVETASCHAGSDADRTIDAESTDTVVRGVSDTDVPVVVDGRGTDDATMAALSDALLRLSATDDRPVFAVVCGLETVLPADEPLDELGRALRRLLAQGPDRDLGVVGVTERPGSVHTAVREARSWTVWHRLTRTADTSVVRRELGGERAQAVRDLPGNEAFLETAWTTAVERIAVQPSGGTRSRAEDTTATRMEPDTDPAGDGRRLDLERLADRLEDLAATVEARIDPDRLAADVAEALEPRLDAVRDGSGGKRETNGSPTTNGTDSTAESTDSDGFAGFDLFDDEGAGESEAASDTDAAADGLAALAGVGDDGSKPSPAGPDDADEPAISDGGLDIDGVSEEVATFEGGASAVGIDAERAGGKPAVVVDVESTLSDLDAAALAMLEHYREAGPARPEAAHSAATDRDSRVPAYTLNRQLRRAGLVEHVGRGRYDYSLRDRIESGLPAERDDDIAAIYVRDAEQAFLD